jgi:hypothetical protein
MRFAMTSLIAVIMVQGTQVAAQDGASYGGFNCTTVPNPCLGQTGTAACTCLNSYIIKTCNGQTLETTECGAVVDAWNCGCEE